MKHICKPIWSLAESTTFMLQGVSNPFVEEIVKLYNPMQGFGFSRLPVAIVNPQMFVTSEPLQHLPGTRD